MAGMLFCDRQSDGNCLVAVCSRLRNLIPLACFLSKDAVINSLRLLVAGATHLHIALQGGTASPPLRLNEPLVLYALQLYVVGTALLEIQLCTFWLHCSLVCFVGVCLCAAALCCTKNKALPSCPGALRRVRSQGRAVCVYRSEVKSLDRRSRRGSAGFW